MNRPPYVIHSVDEKDVTVDWFFGPQRNTRTVAQLILILFGWCFTILPVVITASALVHRDNEEKGWWGYHEGFVMWDMTMTFLGILTGVFIVGFFALYLVNRASTRLSDQQQTYDEERLVQRAKIAADWYADKFGPAALREEQKRVKVEPYGDIETYELRGLYRDYGVD